jgi:hypothetical protein
LTSPGPDDTTRRLGTAATATGGLPQLSVSLARSDLNDSEIQAVGGFARAMQLATTAQLAADSGAKTNFSNDELNSLDGINQPVNQNQDQDSRSFLERAVDGFQKAVSNTGSWLFDNPVTHVAEDVLNQLGNAVHFPFRLLSDTVDGGNDAEVNREMTADGYDPDSTTSRLAFMWSQGENLYHDLSGIRGTYGDDLVDKIIQFQRDPEQFSQDLQQLPADQQQKLIELTNSDDWARAADLMDRKHISPGRDLARLVLPEGAEDTAAFTAISGTLDAAYTWFADPTLILGKAHAAIRTFDVLGRDIAGSGMFGAAARRTVAAVPYLANKRAGVQGITDQAGIEALLRVDPVTGQPVTTVGKAWARYLEDAKSLRAAHAEAEAKTGSAKGEAIARRAGIYRAMDQRYGPLMGMLDEINGTRVIGEAERGVRVEGVNTAPTAQTLTWNSTPIEDMADLTKYLSSTDGLLRMSNGEPARRAMVMPGRLSYVAERKAAENTRVARRHARKVDVFDYTKPDMLPDDSEIALLTATAEQRGKAQFETIRRSILTGGARARAERVNRRLTTTLPTVKRIDLTAGDSAKLVEQVARTYLTKGDAARLASAYSLGNVAQRRQIVKGTINQLFHASGLSRSEDGLAFMKQYLDDFDDVGRTGSQRYGLDDTDLIVDGNGAERRVALLQSQLKTSVVIPSMREMNFHATKLAASGFTRRTGLSSFHKLAQSDGMDYLLGAIKLGWITSVAGGLRNALDEVANFAAYGMGREVASARVAFTRGTAKVRAQKRAASLQYVRDAKANGRLITEEARRAKIGQAYISHDEALAALERAQRGELDLANAEDLPGVRINDALNRLDQARAQVRLRQQAVDALAGSDDVASRTALRDQLFEAQAEEARAVDGLATRRREAAALKPGEATAKVRERLDREGVLSVADAEKQAKRAQKELENARILEQVVRHTIPLAFRYAADTVNDVMVGKVLGKMMRVFGKRFAVTDEMVKYAEELTDRELVNTIRAGVFQSHQWDSGVDDRLAMLLHGSGLKARSYAFRKRYEGWAEVEPDAGAGTEAWAKMLDLAFADPTSPAHAWLDTLRIMRRKPGKPAVDDGAAAFDRLWGSALHRTWDENGSQTREVRVIDRDGVLHASIHDFGANYGSSEQPVEHIYRVVAKSDYERMKRAGVLNTNGRGSHGRYEDPDGLDRPQMFGGIVPTQLAKTYGAVTDSATGRAVDAEDTVLLKIRYRPEDGWYKDMTDGNSSYVATRKEIPFSQVEDAAPFRAIYDEEAEKTSVQGIPWGNTAPVRFDDGGPITGIGQPDSKWFEDVANGQVASVNPETARRLKTLLASEPTEAELVPLREVAHQRFVKADAEYADTVAELETRYGSSEESVLDGLQPGSMEHAHADALLDVLAEQKEAREAAHNEFLDLDLDEQTAVWQMRLEAARADAMREHLGHQIDLGHRVFYKDPDTGETSFITSKDELDPMNDAGIAFDDVLANPGLYGLRLETRVAGSSGLDLAALNSAKAAIVAHMQTPEMEHFRRYGEVFQQLRDGTPATTDVLREQVLEEYADRLSAHLLHATAGRDGEIPPQLLEKLAEAKDTGIVPDSTWLSQEIPAGQRPEKVLGQLWAPFNPAHEPGQLPRGYTQMMATAYDKVVTDQINALSRNPLMTALYINARRNTLDYVDKLQKAGWSEEAATEVAKRQAIRQAELEALKHIDNPYVQSQASLVVRNYATFIRAQEDWLRRWGRTLKDNPQIIRQAQLLIHGAESAGHVELNDQGDLSFTYPGGALMSGVIGKFFGASALPGGITVPITSELSSKVMYLNPSLDNPAGLSATPLLSIPLDAMFDAILGPDQAMLRSSLDKAVNGELGAGRSWMEKLLPSWANRIWQAFGSDDDPASPYGQAYAEALAQLEAAGTLDDPYFQTPTGQADLQHQVSIAVRNNLAWKALFGLFAPAAPQLTIGAEGSLPHDDGHYGSGVKADWIYHEQGLTNLRDEARQMMSQYGYEQARAMWTATHPGELIYFDSARTEVNTPSANAPASIVAAKYIQDNQALFAKYGGQGGVAAYLIPQGRFGTTDGEFSDVAYQAQLESGIRTYKPLSDYFVDVITARGSRDYFAAKDVYDRKHAAQVRAGNKEAADRLEQQWAKQKATIMAANPLLTQRFSQYAVDNAGVANTLSQLYGLVADEDPQIAAGLGRNREGIAALLAARESYQQGIARLDGRRTRQAATQKQALKTRYETQVLRIAGGPDPETGVDNSQYPELADLARGVFRLPE